MVLSSGDQDLGRDESDAGVFFIVSNSSASTNASDPDFLLVTVRQHALQVGCRLGSPQVIMALLTVNILCKNISDEFFLKICINASLQEL